MTEEWLTRRIDDAFGRYAAHAGARTFKAGLDEGELVGLCVAAMYIDGAQGGGYARYLNRARERYLARHGSMPRPKPRPPRSAVPGLTHRQVEALMYLRGQAGPVGARAVGAYLGDGPSSHGGTNTMLALVRRGLVRRTLVREDNPLLSSWRWSITEKGREAVRDA
jgi:hypothetical protein